MSYKLNRADVDHFIMTWPFLHHRALKCVVPDALSSATVSVSKGRSITNEKVRRLTFIRFKHDSNTSNFQETSWSTLKRAPDTWTSRLYSISILMTLRSLRFSLEIAVKSFEQRDKYRNDVTLYASSSSSISVLMFSADLWPYQGPNRDVHLIR